MSDRFRHKELAKIHLLKKQVGLDDDTYRDVLERLTGVRTASDLDHKGRARVLDELKRLMGGTSSFPGTPHNIGVADRARLRKVEALLADQKLPWSYADAIAKQMFRRERVTFCDDEQLRAIVTALTKRQLKHGGQT